jgi:hypothetical protein
MFYAASGAAPVAVSGFRPDPFPALLPGDAKMFVAGVRHDGAFAIEEAAVAISSGGKP